MSGGEAYIFDPKNQFKEKCNFDTFELEELEDKNEISLLHSLIKNHQQYTESEIAKEILNDWSSNLKKFVKVMPTDYKRVLKEINLKKQAV